MARIRSVKPDLFSDVKLSRVSIQARYLYVGMFTEADDEGRMFASTKRLAGALYPHDQKIGEAQVRRWVGELEGIERICRYEVDGYVYFHIPKFAKHQKISHPTPSRLPNCSRHALAAVPEDSGDAPENFVPDREQGTGKGIGKRELAGSFERFWSAYPRKVGRPKAQAAYERASHRSSLAAILSGAERYRDDPNREPQFTAHPTTWLNRDGWQDESLPSRGKAEPPSPWDPRSDAA